jgi:hypothetical protein
MPSREHLQDWVVQALKSMGGSGSIVAVAKDIWMRHESELRAAGDLFFTWQYDMRWACTKLRERKIVQPAELSRRGEWKLN